MGAITGDTGVFYRTNGAAMDVTLPPETERLMQERVERGECADTSEWETKKVFRREFSREFQAVAPVAKRKPDHIHAAATLSDLEPSLAIGWRPLPMTTGGSTAFGPTTSGASASGEAMLTPLVSRLWTTISASLAYGKESQDHPSGPSR